MSSDPSFEPTQGPFGSADLGPRLRKGGEVTTPRGRTCEGIGFPTEAFIRRFIWERVQPFRTRTGDDVPTDPGFVPVRGVGVPGLGGTDAVVSGTYPVGGWARPLADEDQVRTVEAAVDLVCSSYSFVMWGLENERRSAPRFAALVPTLQLPELSVRPLLTTFLRYLPLAAQAANGGPGRASTLQLRVYGERKDVKRAYDELAVPPYRPRVGRWSSRHPVRRLLFDGGVVSQFAQGWCPDYQLRRSWVFPLAWGPATRPDLDRAAVNRLLVLLGGLGFKDPVLPLAGLPLKQRIELVRQANTLIRLSRQTRLDWRDSPPEDDDEEDEEDEEEDEDTDNTLFGQRRSGGGRAWRQFALDLVLSIVTPLGAPLVDRSRANFVMSLRRMVKGLLEAASGGALQLDGEPGRPDEDHDQVSTKDPALRLKGYTINESGAVLLAHLNIAVQELRVAGRQAFSTDPLTGMSVEPYLFFAGRGMGREDTELSVLAAMLMPRGGFARGSPPDGATVIPAPIRGDPHQPARAKSAPVFHLHGDLFYPDYREVIADNAEHHFWLLDAGPTLEFANTLDVAMTLYSLGLQAESAWFALFPAVMSQGRVGYEARLADRDLAALAGALDGVTPAQLIAFVWRQGIVDDFIEHRMESLSRSHVRTLNFRRECLYEIFCWMDSNTNRRVLDLVLGPVTLGDDGRYTRDGASALLVRLLGGRAEDADGLFQDFAQRWARLSQNDRCFVWPRFMSIVRQSCRARRLAALDLRGTTENRSEPSDLDGDDEPGPVPPPGRQHRPWGGVTRTPPTWDSAAGLGWSAATRPKWT